MFRIMVIFTGGTIGSKKRQAIDVDSAVSYELIHRYNKDSDVHPAYFETVHPMNLLSENLIPGDWEKLYQAVKAIDVSMYDGIIITHGTDTLPYTAAAMSYTLNDCPAPIVMIASNYPLDDPRSSGYNNFVNAVNFIADTSLPGVYVSFENRAGKALIHLGTRLQQSDPFTDEYESAYGTPFGFMERQRFLPVIHPANPALETIRDRSIKTFENPRYSAEILYIRPHPGLTYDYYRFQSSKPKAVLHDLYHSGTASTRLLSDGSRHDLSAFIRFCGEQQIDLYISPIKRASDELYQSTVTLLEAGALPLASITVEAALVKLMLAYGSFNSKEHIRTWLTETNVFYERI
ncbi:asparaginase [Paenibacillus tarimensis]